MAKPTQKAEVIDNFITNAFGIDRKATIRADVCTMCQKPATEFKDELSRKEYRISGMCQKCQDDIFG